MHELHFALQQRHSLPERIRLVCVVVEGARSPIGQMPLGEVSALLRGSGLPERVHLLLSSDVVPSLSHCVSDVLKRVGSSAPDVSLIDINAL